jgi:predicted solute-binding protein
MSEEAALELKLPATVLTAYLRRNIDYSLDEDNRQGLEHFFARSAALGLIAKNLPICWVGYASLLRQSVGNRT